ncbi:MAG TPA: alpha/beta hydrolase [Leptolyngbyaceae cyanobacterium]
MSLEQRLRRAGYATEHFGYFAIAESFDSIVERLHLKLQQIAWQGPYAVVAHSLGGILTRAALALGQVRDPEQIVMLGTPNQPPRLALHAWRVPPFRWFTGQCGFKLTCTQFYGGLPMVQSPYTIVAGTLGPRGPLSPFGDEVNDGIVALSETRILPHDAVVQLPVWHTFMMNDSRVQDVVIQSLMGIGSGPSSSAKS